MFRSSLVAGCLVALTLAPAAAQQPTQAQRDAVRAACRSDFMANCASVQPGGKEALECLLRNEPKLSPPCRSAVNAIAAPASSPAAPAPTAASPPEPSGASAPAQSSMPATAVPPSTKTPATAPARKTPSTMRTTTVPAAPTASASGLASGPAAAPAVPPLGPIRPMPPRRALMILAQCRPDQQRLCAGVPAGGGKIFSCLAANAQQLSPICYDALARVSE
ncbi:MAG: hypothetical protein WAM72_05115 [Xanthobacteraceae bacterium]|jgi:hypothetical protein